MRVLAARLGAADRPARRRQSKGGTLELEGTERLPVARPNLDGDPNTDELLELLGGLAAASAEPAAAARPAPRAAFARATLTYSRPTRAAGAPTSTSPAWAHRRGLSFRGGTPRAAVSVTCRSSEDVLFNVVRGRWPGGTDGVLCHEVRLFDVDTAGLFHGGKVIGTRESLAGFLLDAALPLPLGGGGRSFFKVPYTCAGARVPHLATITGLHVARVAERRIGADPPLGSWQERVIDDLGRQGHWVAHSASSPMS